MKIPRPRTIREAWQLAQAYTRYKWHEHGERVWGVRGPGVGESWVTLETLCLEIRMYHMTVEMAQIWEQTITVMLANCMDTMEAIGKALEDAIND